MDEKRKYTDGIKGFLKIIEFRYPVLKDRPYHQFLYWFMWLNFKWGDEPTEKPPEIVMKFLCDNKNDQTIDSFYFDDENQIVYLIQSKYILNWNDIRRITYNELKRTADIINYFENPNTSSIIYQKANQTCRQLLGKAIEKIRKGYKPRIILVSNKLSPEESNLKKLEELTGIDIKNWDFEIFDREKLISLYIDFLEGHNPPLPPVFFPIETQEYLRYYEKDYALEIYVAIMSARIFIELYNKFGNRIFEKNVRSYLGNIFVNQQIRKTLKEQPKLFLFKNSGITMLGSNVEPISKKAGQEPGFRIKDVQIINGQQTIRAIAEQGKHSPKVLAMIIVPYQGAQLHGKEDIVTDIIAARNFQNKIDYSDLRSNFPEQVKLWRELKEKGYYYERKKKGWQNFDIYGRSLYSLASQYNWAVIKKNQLAQVVLAVKKDPQLAYQGADFIFREMYDIVFPKNLFSTLLKNNYYLDLFLLWKRYVRKVGKEFNTYPQYHILNFLVKSLKLSFKNSRRFFIILEKERLFKPLLLATKILYRLCDKIVEEEQRKSKEKIGSNDIFGKRLGILKTMMKLFSSQKFSKERKKFSKTLAETKQELSSINVRR